MVPGPNQGEVARLEPPMAKETLASLSIKINSHLSPIHNIIILKEKARNKLVFNVQPILQYMQNKN